MPYVNGRWVKDRQSGKVISSKNKEEQDMVTNESPENESPENQPKRSSRQQKNPVERSLGVREANVQDIIEIASRVQEIFGATGNFDSVFSEIMRVCYPY